MPCVCCSNWYLVMDESVGSSQVRSTCASPTVAERLAGAAGTTPGVAVTVDGAPMPEPLTACTARVYPVPLVSPVTVYAVVM